MLSESLSMCFALHNGSSNMYCDSLYLPRKAVKTLKLQIHNVNELNPSMNWTNFSGSVSEKCDIFFYNTFRDVSSSGIKHQTLHRKKTKP